MSRHDIREGQAPEPATELEKRIASALEANLGMRTLTAQSLGLSVDYLSEQIARSPYLREALARVEELGLDQAESALLRAVQGEYDPDTRTMIRRPERWAIEYYLNHKGRRRGYGHLTSASEPPPALGSVQALPSHIRDVILYDEGALDLACRLAERTANRRPVQLPPDTSRDGDAARPDLPPAPSPE